LNDPLLTEAEDAPEDPFLAQLKDDACAAGSDDPFASFENLGAADGGEEFHLSQDEAFEIGQSSKPCLPWEVATFVRRRVDRKRLRRALTRAQLIEWLVQHGIESILGVGAALLLLRVLSHVSPTRDGKIRAWIGRGKLASHAGKHRKTIDRYAVSLTQPLHYDDRWHAPLFRICLVGRSVKRRAEWEPVLQGWIDFMQFVAETVQARKDAERERRQRERLQRGERRRS
jgi:hypothetical protein